MNRSRSWETAHGKEPRKRDRSRERPVPTEAQAWTRILNWFGLRARTEFETSRKLTEWGVDEATRERLIERLRELRLLDDEAFASALASELSRKGMRGAAVRQRLMRRGVPRTAIDAAVDVVEPEDVAGAALELARKRARQPGMTVQRLANWLLRRGYPHAEAFRAAAEALDVESQTAFE